MKLWRHGSLLLLLAAGSVTKPWVHAWILGTISGLSLPLGACLGILFTPVRDEVCAAWMALGAGALLFAVTVELYGHALRELEHGRAGLLEIAATVLGACLGALFYLWVNRLLDGLMSEAADEDLEQPHCLMERSDSPEHTPTVSEATPLNSALKSKMSTPSGNHPSISVRDDSFSQSRISSWAAYSEPRNSASDFEHISINSRTRDRVMKRMTRSAGDVSARSRQTSSARSDVSNSPVAGENSPSNKAGSNKDSFKVDPEVAAKCKHVAFALFLGILVDGVPEGILMGFLAAEGHLSWVLVFSLLVANFPEAFSSASLMRQGGESKVKIIGMWGGLCLLVGALAGMSCFLLIYFFPTYPHGNLPAGCLLLVALVEGLTGGAMIACISTVMLPEAFQRAGKHGALCLSSGFLCTAGFLVAVVLKALEHHYNNTHDTPGIYGHSFYLPGLGSR